MLVKKADRVDVECVVRGYLAGSGWASYQKTGEICGQKLPDLGYMNLIGSLNSCSHRQLRQKQGEHDEPIYH